MKFFNLDLHVSVIADLRWILGRLGHEVTDWSLSNHTWVFGRRPHRVEVVTRSTWREIDQEMCDRFYHRYRQELAGYDGFLVTHTPCFAQLFERWGKPIVVVASTRYEHPLTSDPARWESFNRFLLRMAESGRLTCLANNHYDAAYAEHFTGLPWRVIPSLCSYTGMTYTGRRPRFLCEARSDHLPLPEQVVLRRRAFGGFWRALRGMRGRHRWEELADFQGVVHLPYNASVMSIFEQFQAAIPLFFPAREFMAELYEQGLVLSEISFKRVEQLPPAPGRDPNNYADTALVMEWLERADFYQLPHLEYFQSFPHLDELLTRVDLQAISQRMQGAAREREANIMEAWSRVLKALAREVRRSAS